MTKDTRVAQKFLNQLHYVYISFSINQAVYATAIQPIRRQHTKQIM